jgi:hypothetical protein
MYPIFCGAPLIVVGAVIALLYPGQSDAVLAAQAVFVVIAAIGHAVMLALRNGRAS